MIFLHPVDAYPLPSPNERITQWEHSPGPTHSFSASQDSCSHLNLFYLFSRPSLNPWAPTESQRDRNGPKFPSLNPVTACSRSGTPAGIPGCSPELRLQGEAGRSSRSRPQGKAHRSPGGEHSLLASLTPPASPHLPGHPRVCPPVPGSGEGGQRG